MDQPNIKNVYEKIGNLKHCTKLELISDLFDLGLVLENQIATLFQKFFPDVD